MSATRKNLKSTVSADFTIGSVKLLGVSSAWRSVDSELTSNTSITLLNITLKGWVYLSRNFPLGCIILDLHNKSRVLLKTWVFELPTLPKTPSQDSSKSYFLQPPTRS